MANELNDQQIHVAPTTVHQFSDDAISALYMHPSDSPGMVLVPTPFDGLVKNKLGFITGDCKRLADDAAKLRQWERCDDMVTSWILNSLSKEIAESVKYVANSIELWKEREDRYDQTNGAKLYQIQKEINDLVQGAIDITTYYMRMKKLREEFNNLSFRVQCSCQCVCGAKEGTYKAEQDRRLIQFLMGLNE
ncbi:uncharacterized protein LOC107865182 [Capsicum annuum]|uniref:uncharacterized protein LOC107865182 n=1 Tax=Capsicum annuum TaxID=4072 RepID=UPI0007BF420C|nr:uncharacterized protein LOC107865182 [Capsicum annuum]